MMECTGGGEGKNEQRNVREVSGDGPGPWHGQCMCQLGEALVPSSRPTRIWATVEALCGYG